MNTFGRLFRVTTFGESHGAGLGCVVDGCPSGVRLNPEDLVAQLDRRRPGQSKIASSRNEPDRTEILSGILRGVTLGTPIAMLVRNRDARSEDYETIREQPRRGHADSVWKAKFGHVDHRGGGRASARETVARVMAAWVAEGLLAQVMPEMQIVAWVSRVGKIRLPEEADRHPWTREEVDSSITRCPEPDTAALMEECIVEAGDKGDSLGGTISLRVSGLKSGLGEPVFLKLHSYLAAALASIQTVNGLSWNQRPLDIPGSEFHAPGNTYGGINGGISNGEELLWRVACKPVSTLGDVAKAGRHDPCVLPRAVPIVESMAALVLADLYLIGETRTVES